MGLQQKCKWFKSRENVKEGALVIIHSDNTPPQQWVLARMIKSFPGSDGKVRVVELKTSEGILRHSIHKIASLPNEID